METDNYTLNNHIAVQHYKQSDKEQIMMSSSVWIVLFSLLITISIISNVFYVVSLIYTKRSLTMTHIVICSFFVINLLEYSTLVMDWSLIPDVDNMWCSWYMFSTHTTTCLNTILIVLLLYFVYNPVNSKSLPRASSVSLLSGIVISVSVSTPTLIYSGLDDQGMCNMIVSEDTTLNSSFLMFYNSVLPFWLPVTIVCMPLLRMMRLMNSAEDRDSEVNINFVIIVSFVVFYSPFSSLVFIRDSLKIGLLSTTKHNTWILHILQSLFLLFTYFFHIFRPLATFLLDPELDLKRTQYHVPVYKI